MTQPEIKHKKECQKGTNTAFCVLLIFQEVF
ncbi:MAG TPA: hypothetical protein DHV15_00660 [Treponema sp.]|uniref:Uncharacterized protein n=1 Tax=Treponema denticola (strain ATCC 35405 / DSM 14222 / CIP 103919 / JCM 8153 / KCTC 15104) TaxID=243275 RepID=Q73P64_TREDE|nr:hypothetical protein TDE_0935 [Treponema denticola ATCC 35405]UTY25498.1 hypothetical protein E4N77_01520 [Treponema denticola]HCY94012.1 hypothetical protein [Treponema sp.]